MTIKLAGTKFALGAEFVRRNANEIGLSGAVDVRAFGAKGDGVTDDTAAIRAAVASAAGKQVLFPKGQYLINADAGAILLENVALRGEFVLDGATAQIDEGSVFRIIGTTNSPFRVRRGVSIKGIGFYYPLQVDSASPVVYPATLDFEFSNGPVQFVEISGCVVYNAYRWINIDNAGGAVGHVWIADNTVYGIHRCIEITHNLEVIKITGNSFTFGHWLAATESESRSYTRQNGVVLEYKRGDGVFFTENMLFGYLTGMLLSSGGAVALCRISDNTFDSVRYGIRAAGSGNFTASQVVGNDFVSANLLDTTAQGNAIRIETSGATGETLVIDGNHMSSATEDAIFVTGNTPTRWLTITNNNFTSWARDKVAGTYFAINASGASTNIIAQGCLFAGSNSARTSGIGGSLNTVTATGNAFNACQNALAITANVVTHSGNVSFGTVSSTADSITASINTDTGNGYDKPSGATTRPAFLARKNASQTFSSGSAEDVTFATEVYDRGGNFASPTFTAPRAGRYQFWFSLFHDNTGTANDRWTITILSSASGALQQSYLMPANYNSISGGGCLQLQASETVKLQVARVGGAGNFVTFNDANANFFGGALIE